MSDTPLPDAPPPEAYPPGEPAGPKKRRSRPWSAKFADAFRGLDIGVRGHSSFFVHFFMAAAVVAAAAALRCDQTQWCILIACIGGVLTAELFNSTVETLFRSLDASTRDRGWPALDVSAAAVLVASLTAAVIGTIIFASRLLACLGLFSVG